MQNISTWLKRLKNISLCFLFVAFSIKQVNATTYTSATTGNWSTATNWTPNGVPGAAAGDTVIIADGTTVTIDATPANALASLTIGQGTSGALQFGMSVGGFQLKVNGTITVGNGGYFGANQSATGGATQRCINSLFNSSPVVINGAGRFVTFNTNNPVSPAIISVVFVNGDYCSKTSGNWSAAATWEMNDGTAWVAALTPPTASSNVWIQSVNSTTTHTVTVDADATVANLLVSGNSAQYTNGATLQFKNSGTTNYTLTVTNDIVIGSTPSNGNGGKIISAAATPSASAAHTLKIGGRLLICTGGSLNAALNLTDVTNGPNVVAVNTEFTGSSSAIWQGLPPTFGKLKINDGATLTAKNAFTCTDLLTVGDGASGVLQVFDSSVAVTMNANGGIMITTGGVFQSFPLPAFNGTHLLNVKGNIVNNGSVNFRNTSGGYTSIINTAATGSASYSYSGNGANLFNNFSQQNTAASPGFILNGDMNLAGQLLIVTNCYFGLNGHKLSISGTNATGSTYCISNPAGLVTGGAGSQLRFNGSSGLQTLRTTGDLTIASDAEMILDGLGSSYELNHNNANPTLIYGKLTIVDNPTITSNLSMNIQYGVGSTLQYVGSVNRTAGSTNFPYEWPLNVCPTNVIVDNSGGVTMPSNASRTIDGVLTLQNGILNIANNTLTLSSAASGAVSYGTASSFSASNMVKADGGGQLVRAIASGISSNTDYVFPVGNGVPDYFGLSLSFSSTTTGGNLGVKISTADHANMGTPAIHLTRYWTCATPLSGNYTYTATLDHNAGTYLSGAPESMLHLSRWNGSAWTEYSGSSGAGGVLTETTPLNETTAPLSFDFTGRTGGPVGITETGNAAGGFQIVKIHADNGRQTTSMTITATRESLCQLSVYDVFGHVVKRTFERFSKGNNDVTIDFSSVSHALYIVVLDNYHEIINRKFVY